MGRERGVLSLPNRWEERGKRGKDTTHMKPITQDNLLAPETGEPAEKLLPAFLRGQQAGLRPSPGEERYEADPDARISRQWPNREMRQKKGR